MKLRGEIFGGLILAAAFALPVAPQTREAEAAQATIEAARKKELVDGDLEGAINLYKEVVSKHPTLRNAVADALTRMSEAYQKLGGFTSRSQLKPRLLGLFTIPVNMDARSSYDLLAQRAGLNAVYASTFSGGKAVPLRIENLDIFDALDNLSMQTGNVWFPWDSRTIFVVPDNAQSRRDFEPQILQTIYLGGGAGSSATANNVRQVAMELRNQLKLRQVFPSASRNALVIRDTPDRVRQAEEIAARLTGTTGLPRTSVPMRMTDARTDEIFLGENGNFRKVTPSSHSILKDVAKGAVTIDLNDSPLNIYEALASRAGLNVIVSPTLRSQVQHFKLESADLLDALDLLALQTSTLWVPLNESTIWLMNDTAQNRRNYLPSIVKTVYLAQDSTEDDANEIVNIARTVMQARNIFQDVRSKSIIIRDTPNMLYAFERVVADLDRKGGRPASVTLETSTSRFYAESGWKLATANAARSQLDVNLRGRTNIRLNEEPRIAFEKLGEMAGLQVVFDSRVTEGPATPFNLNGVDILDALDLLAFQTKHFWQVVDARTIRVASDTTAVRRELEPVLTKTFYPADANPTVVRGVVNLVRIMFLLREVSVDDKNAIVVRDTADNIGLVEELLKSIDMKR